MMKNLVRVFTYWNVVCPVALSGLSIVVFSLDLGIGGGSALDYAMYLLAWSWLAGTPLVVTAALLANRAVDWRPGRIINRIVGVLWLITAIALFLIPFSY